MTLLHQAAQKAVEALPRYFLETSDGRMVKTESGPWIRYSEVRAALMDSATQQPTVDGGYERDHRRAARAVQKAAQQWPDLEGLSPENAIDLLRFKLSAIQQEIQSAPAYDWKTIASHYEAALRHLAENAFASKDWQFARAALNAGTAATKLAATSSTPENAGGVGGNDGR